MKKRLSFDEKPLSVNKVTLLTNEKPLPLDEMTLLQTNG
jgi:hypothetical protein